MHSFNPATPPNRAKQLSDILNSGDHKILHVHLDYAPPSSTLVAMIVGRIGEGAFGLVFSPAQKTVTLMPTQTSICPFNVFVTEISHNLSTIRL